MATSEWWIMETTHNQDFRLTWVNYSQKLTESFHKFLTSEILCNVTLWVHNATSGSNLMSGGSGTSAANSSNSIKAHQAILSACSPWFEEVLSQSQHPHPVIILKDVRFQDLKNIIRFIYTGEVFVPQHELHDFLKTAELLEIKGLLRDADNPSWSNLSSLFSAAPAAAAPTNQLLSTSPSGLMTGNLNPSPQQQKIVNIINSNSAGTGQVMGAQPHTILPTLPTVPVSSVFLPSSEGASQINDLVSQIKVPVSFSSCQSAAKLIARDGTSIDTIATLPTPGVTAHQQTSPLTTMATTKKRKNSKHGLVVQDQQQIMLHRSVDAGLATLDNGQATKRQRIGLANQQNLEIVETQLVVTGDQAPDSLLASANVEDDAVSWIEEVPSTQASISSGGMGSNNEATGQSLTPAEWVSTGINDCGAFKTLWAERYLCYNLGREIICLVCFCRFTQFKKFNLERHMKNKHPQLLSLGENKRREILEKYVARLIHHVTVNNAQASRASTIGEDTSSHQDVASEILSLGPIQLDDLSQGPTISAANSHTVFSSSLPDGDARLATTSNLNSSVLSVSGNAACSEPNGDNGVSDPDPMAASISEASSVQPPEPIVVIKTEGDEIGDDTIDQEKDALVTSQEPPEDLMDMECELEESEGEMLMVK